MNKKITAKCIRLIARIVNKTRNIFLKNYLELKYQNCSLNGSQLGTGINIVCVDGAKLIIENCTIGDGSMIFAGQGGIVEIYSSFIGRNCIIVGREKITIGSDCLIAEMVVIRDQNHKYSDFNIPISKQGMQTSPITIGKNVWLGAKATVLAGSDIADNTVIGAHSLVNGKLDSGVYVGTPAKWIKNLKNIENGSN